MTEHSQTNNNTIYKGDKLGIFVVNDTSILKGGHHFKYDFIPLNEVWISNKVQDSEILFIVIHELYERALMKTKKIKFEVAEQESKKIESTARSVNDHKIMKKYIMDLIKVNES
jgi:hypothetical protein